MNWGIGKLAGNHCEFYPIVQSISNCSPLENGKNQTCCLNNPHILQCWPLELVFPQSTFHSNESFSPLLRSTYYATKQWSIFGNHHISIAWSVDNNNNNKRTDYHEINCCRWTMITTVANGLDNFLCNTSAVSSCSEGRFLQKRQLCNKIFMHCKQYPRINYSSLVSL